MAAPNLANPTSVTGKCVEGDLSLSSTQLLLCAANRCLKLNHIRATNTHTSSVTTTFLLKKSGTGAGVEFTLADTFYIDSTNSAVVLDRAEFVYLEEGDSIYGSASVDAVVDYLITYEEVA